MPVELIEARDPRLRADVFRFRYDVHVREMGRPQKDADHARGRIEDRLDTFARLMAARDTVSGRVVGTVRANVLGDGDIGGYAALYGLDRLSTAERRVTSITTRLMIERSGRGTLLAGLLAAALYAWGLERGVRTDYIDCHAHLVPFFERLGYRAQALVRHPEYGMVTLMRIDLGDVAHLRRIGSPLLGVRERRPHARGWSRLRSLAH